MPTTIDLTHPITESMPVYPGTEGPIILQANTIEKDGFAEKKLCMYSHTGTHMDAPAHMIPGAITLDRFPISKFTGTAFLLDVRNHTADKISLEYVNRFEAELRQAEFLILHTGWSAYWGTERYFESFPTLTTEAAAWVATLGLKGIGLDVISVDPVGNDFSNHLHLLGAEMVIIENLTSLESLPNQFQFYCLPLRIENSDGSPIRAMASFE